MCCGFRLKACASTISFTLPSSIRTPAKKYKFIDKSKYVSINDKSNISDIPAMRQKIIHKRSQTKPSSSSHRSSHVFLTIVVVFTNGICMTTIFNCQFNKIISSKKVRKFSPNNGFTLKWFYLLWHLAQLDLSIISTALLHRRVPVSRATSNMVCSFITTSKLFPLFFYKEMTTDF